ncbi:MAG: glycosyl hydrolase [Blastocatellia bacterium]|nr:glycosyl hydrolase [Blastocatellia bacterium]
MKIFLSILLSLLFINPLPIAAQEKTSDKDKDPMSTATFSGLKLRSIGPAVTSGRVSAIAVNPNDRSHYIVGAASGGVWVTKNAGTTWTPVFDNEGSYSIGAVTIDPKNPNIVWVGTGENNSQRSVGYGDGLYKSEDGCKSWKKVGLQSSEHIARIVIDPRSSNTVYVAAQGPLWGSGGDRGLFKTTDGGKNWKNILSISENTGVTDVAMDQKNPDTLYAAAYQRRRHVWTLINGGPEAALYKSTDAGESWKKVTSGLPNVELGRIGLAISPADSSVVYAIVEAANKKGGIFCSTDYGETWEKRNDFDSTAMYYGQVIADPKDVNRIYIPNVYNLVSDDGGKTLRRLGEKFKHVDNHVIWIDPTNTNYYLVGCDGGIYESFDRGANWDFKSNLPITQFYDVTVDNSSPFYYVYGGTQDNFSLGGPSRTRSITGITNADWFVTQGGDGFRSVVDPQDPNIIYSEYQYGGITRFDKRTGERMGIKPQEGRGEPPLRWNWDSPLIISPHLNTRLYFAANKLFRSDDRGNTWKAVSGDLTRNLDRDKLPVMGKIWSPDAVAKHASTSFYGNITALAESPKKEGLLYVGTDDGLIQVSEDGGQNWRKTEKFPSVPEFTYVSRILASQHDINTVYATFDNHKNADFAPYILKSTDKGKSWSSIKSNLPANGPLLAIAEDHVKPELLFLGNEFGLFFSNDGGQKWVQLKGNFPTIAVRDLAIQKRENDLVVGTFGRGIYILDDYTLLRTINNELLAKEAHLFTVKDALLYIESRPYGGRGNSFQGSSFFAASNPPFGATFTYYLKDSLKTKKQKRQEAQKEAEKKNSQLPYPSQQDFRDEELEPAPEIIVTVTDSAGNVIRKLKGTNQAGINRVTWDLRYPVPDPISTAPQKSDDDDDDSAGGVLVLPGSYTISIAKRVNGVLSQLTEPVQFNVYADGTSTMKPEDRAALLEFQKKLSRLYAAVFGSIEAANSLKTKIGLLKQALKETPTADAKLMDDLLAIERKNNDLLRELRGDTILAARNENVPPAIADRVSQIASEQGLSTSRPTQTHIDSYKIAAEEFTQILARLKTLAEVDLKNLEKAMEALGSPWTPGRIPEWSDK